MASRFCSSPISWTTSSTGARALVVAGEEREALGDRQRLVHRRRLQDDADLLAPSLVGLGRVRAEHGDRAGVALAVALEDLDGRRLAGAVGAEEAEDLARGDLEADPADGLDLAVGLAEIGNGDCTRHIW